MRLRLMVAVRAVEPFPAWEEMSRLEGIHLDGFVFEGGNVQQGARIETCALRMCLLEEIRYHEFLEG